MWAEIVYGKQEQDTEPVPRDALPEIPAFYKAEPAVLEAGRIIRGCSIAHFITDIREVDRALYDEMGKP